MNIYRPALRSARPPLIHELHRFILSEWQKPESERDRDALQTACEIFAAYCDADFPTQFNKGEMTMVDRIALNDACATALKRAKVHFYLDDIQEIEIAESIVATFTACGEEAEIETVRKTLRDLVWANWSQAAKV